MATSPSIRLKIGLAALAVVFLALTGIRPDALPFNPGARFSDAATSHWPAALFLRQSVLDAHRFPLWRDSLLAGQPFAANPLNKTAYPLQWITLALPPTLHLEVMIVLHLALAGIGMGRWARRLGLRSEAAALSALAYMLAPRLIGHTGAGHLDLLYALAWWPWLMEAVEAASADAQKGVPTGQAQFVGTRFFASVFKRPSRWVGDSLRIGLLAGLIFLADVRLSLFALSLAAAYGVYRSVQQRQRPLLMPIGALGVFLVLTASVTVPLALWRPYLSRGDLTPADAGVFSLEWGHLAGLILPAHSGNIETLTYLGLTVLALAAIAVISQPRRMAFWWMACLAAILYGLGSNGFLWPALVRLIPALLWFRVPSRAWFVVALVTPLLAGYGLERLMVMADIRADIRAENPRPLRPVVLRRAKMITLGGLAAALACGGFTLLSLPLPKSVGLSVLIVGGALGALLLAALNRRLTPQRLALLLIALTVADLAWTGVHWLEWRAPDDWLTPYAALAERLKALEPGRIYSPNYSLPQTVAAAYDLRLFGGVDPFQLTGVVRAIEQGSGVQSAGYSVILPLIDAKTNDLSQVNRDAVIDTHVLAEWGVSHVAATYPIENNRLNLVDTVNGVSIYANLDYTPEANPGAIPDWPAGWPDLPDAGTVARINQWTVDAAVVSGMGFAVSAGMLILLARKRVELKTQSI